MRKIIYISIALLSLSSCITYQKCVDRYGVVIPDTVEVIRELSVPFEVILPSDTVMVEIDCDSLMNLSRESKHLQSDVTVRGNVAQVVSFIKRDTIRDSIMVHDTINVSVPSMVLNEPLKWYEKLWNNYKDFSAWAFLCCILATVLIIKFKK